MPDLLIRLALASTLLASPLAAQELLAPAGLPVLGATPTALVGTPAGIAAVAADRSGAPVSVAPGEAVILLASAPARAGLPAPSIILGAPQAEVTEANFAVVPDTVPRVEAQELSYDSFEARVAMRSGQPELFATLLADGLFDPPQADLAAALQTELQRMGCYRSTIDGDWGRGTQGTVTRYYEEVGAAAQSTDATVELYRDIVSRDDVECPAPAQPVATTQPRPTTTANNGGSNTAPRPTTPAPQPAPAPAPQPSAPSGGFSGFSGVGVVR